MSDDLRDPLLLCAREAAKCLRISERTLWTMTQRGEVPYVRLGRRVLYPTDRLAEWVKARTRGGSML